MRKLYEEFKKFQAELAEKDRVFKASVKDLVNAKADRYKKMGSRADEIARMVHKIQKDHDYVLDGCDSDLWSDITDWNFEDMDIDEDRKMVEVCYESPEYGKGNFYYGEGACLTDYIEFPLEWLLDEVDPFHVAIEESKEFRQKIAEAMVTPKRGPCQSPPYMLKWEQKFESCSLSFIC
jgi:hypothetical protein